MQIGASCESTGNVVADSTGHIRRTGSVSFVLFNVLLSRCHRCACFVGWSLFYGLLSAKSLQLYDAWHSDPLNLSPAIKIIRELRCCGFSLWNSHFFFLSSSVQTAQSQSCSFHERQYTWLFMTDSFKFFLPYTCTLYCYKLMTTN